MTAVLFVKLPLGFVLRTYLVVLEHCKLNLLSLMLVLLGSSVRLLLSFLGTTTKSQHKMKR